MSSVIVSTLVLLSISQQLLCHYCGVELTGAPITIIVELRIVERKLLTE